MYTFITKLKHTNETARLTFISSNPCYNIYVHVLEINEPLVLVMHTLLKESSLIGKIQHSIFFLLLTFARVEWLISSMEASLLEDEEGSLADLAHSSL